MFTPDLTNLPTQPGVYLYRNLDKEIIYVGKAINLKKRVSQYFQRDDALGPKTKTLVSQIASIETRIVDSEIEALILEASLIKKYKPKYNSLLKDDRSYVYVCLTKEKLPRLFSAHRSGIPDSCHTFGPFPNGRAVRFLLKAIRRIFPYLSLKVHPPRPCLYCHMGACPGPNPDPIKYRQQISKIKKILQGNFKGLQRQLKKEMDAAVLTENFEVAIEARDDLDAINYVVSGWNQLSTFYDTVTLPDDQTSNALHELLTTLKPYFPFLKQIKRMECFDISNLGSHYFVGSMSVFIDGTFAKSEYRKFKIYTKDTQDDQFMIREVIWRRLRHPEWGSPDLMIVDGGKPQVTAALSAISLRQQDGLKSYYALIGLAKKHETIVIKNDSEWVEINLPLHSHALHVLQLIRNEAHRFANRYRQELVKRSLNLSSTEKK